MSKEQVGGSLLNDYLVLHTTWLYYQEGKSQTEVTALMGGHITVVKYRQSTQTPSMRQQACSNSLGLLLRTTFIRKVCKAIFSF
ncbi:hypothetical protein [Providencia vermicola]|uniref:hypothetical protein n=1 Tax=Providencia vermicola TaxID=333965 RepID=UPI0021FF4235|nr:hypothetical protein NFC79_00590 [Providencia stuartii]